MKRRLPTLLIAAALTVSALAVVQWTGTGDATGAQSATVSMHFNAFHPPDIVVAAGTTVTWTNDDWDSGEYHNVFAANDAFASQNFGPGEWFSVYLEFPGYYEYYCDLHAGMFGSITVE